MPNVVLLRLPRRYTLFSSRPSSVAFRYVGSIVSFAIWKTAAPSNIQIASHMNATPTIPKPTTTTFFLCAFSEELCTPFFSGPWPLRDVRPTCVSEDASAEAMVLKTTPPRKNSRSRSTAADARQGMRKSFKRVAGNPEHLGKITQELGSKANIISLLPPPKKRLCWPKEDQLRLAHSAALTSSRVPGTFSASLQFPRGILPKGSTQR